MKSRTGLVYSDLYLRHDTGSHPESARQLAAIREDRKLLLCRPSPRPPRLA